MWKLVIAVGVDQSFEQLNRKAYMTSTLAVSNVAGFIPLAHNRSTGHNISSLLNGGLHRLKVMMRCDVRPQGLQNQCESMIPVGL